MRQRLRMRALRTGASLRGLEPTIRIASASSMPAIVGVEQVGGAAEARDRASCRPGGSRGSATPSALHQQLQREHLLDGARGRRRCAPMRFGSRRLHALRRSRRRPRRQVAARSRPSSRTIRPVEALRPQAVDQWRVLSEIHSSFTASLMRGRMRITSRPRASTRMARADRVHHVDRFGLGQLPGPRLEGVGLGGQRADRAEVDDVALQLGASSPARGRS